VVFLKWDLEGDTLYALTASGSLAAIPVASRDGRLRLGSPRLLSDLPVSPEATSFAIAPGAERFLFVDHPDAAHEAFTVLLDWPARLGR